MIKSDVHLQKTLQWSLLLDHEPDFNPLIFYDSKLHLLLFLYPKNFKVLPLTNKTLKIPSRIFYPPAFLYETLFRNLKSFRKNTNKMKKPEDVDLLFFSEGIELLDKLIKRSNSKFRNHQFLGSKESIRTSNDFES
jgi:hypothetical protein